MGTAQGRQGAAEGGEEGAHRWRAWRDLLMRACSLLLMHPCVCVSLCLCSALSISSTVLSSASCSLGSWLLWTQLSLRGH